MHRSRRVAAGLIVCGIAAVSLAGCCQCPPMPSEVGAGPPHQYPNTAPPMPPPPPAPHQYPNGTPN